MLEQIIGSHPSFTAVLDIVRQVSWSDAIIIIRGESGTGKELLARCIHEKSSRSHKQFIPLNCSAMPETLIESELFGHTRGAFTGAMAGAPGWLELANGGTMLLDEIGDMPLSVQPKLLRVLETGEYAAVGGKTIKRCDIRFIASTNKDLESLSRTGRFRDDLYYRLNVIDLTIPPLRERGADLAWLIEHFRELFARQYAREGLQIAPEAMRILKAYSYPGNVRELRNLINRAVLLAEGDLVTVQHLPSRLCDSRSAGDAAPHHGFRAEKRRAIERFEKKFIEGCLESARGNVAEAARSAGIHVTNLHQKIRKYEINVLPYKQTKTAVTLIDT